MSAADTACRCTERQVRYDNGEWSRTLEIDVSHCPMHREPHRPTDRCRVEYVKFGERHSCVRVAEHSTHRCGCGATVVSEGATNVIDHG